uniref:Uncharacterized protein n=1 Tax=Marseillevirus LCMAC102 TaxID=2506603 RepID=A0A481YVR0_9VIRU|nr:MAG: hypothetical protein LCMAC102_03810 [Marseillevirus LCMAC102]
MEDSKYKLRFCKADEPIQFNYGEEQLETCINSPEGYRIYIGDSKCYYSRDNVLGIRHDSGPFSGGSCPHGWGNDQEIIKEIELLDSQHYFKYKNLK